MSLNLMMVRILLLVLYGYLTCGLIFALPFALLGAKRMDPHAVLGSWGFRIAIIPGTLALWPLLLRRWVTGARNPPEGVTSHRPRTEQHKRELQTP